MRFFLDHDVSALCIPVLQAAGHDAWTAAQAKLDLGADDDLVVYADDHDAVFITQDHEITDKRLDAPMTRIVRLDCPKPLAAQVLETTLDDYVALLARYECVIVIVNRQSATKTSFTVHR